MKNSLTALFLIFAASFFLREANQSNLDGLSLRLRLVAESGEASECGGTLWAEGDGVRRSTEESTQLCHDGWLIWHDVTPGTYRIMSQAKNMILMEKVVTLENESVNLGEITLVPGRTIQGIVFMGDVPVEGALVLVEGGRRTQSDADGRFSVKGLPKTALSLRAAAQAGRGALEISADESDGLVMQLERGKGQGLLGLRFERKERGLVVTELLSNTAAAEFLERGDLLLKVDGVEVSELASEQVAQVLAGEIDSLATLVIQRAGESRTLELRRIDPLELTR
jgi:hypothetical protein